MSSREPPSARLAIMTPFSAALAWPSTLADAWRADMPPHAEADVAVVAVDSLQDADPPPDGLPQAATTKRATTARPRWREKLPNLMLRSSPSNAGPAPAPNEQGQ